MSRYTSVIIFLLFPVCLSFSLNSCVRVTNTPMPDASGTDYALYGHVFNTIETAGPYWCARRCLQQRKCRSVNYHPLSNKCQLSRTTASRKPHHLMPTPGALYYDMRTIPKYFLGPCENHTCHREAVCQPVTAATYRCHCMSQHHGENNCTLLGTTPACSLSPCAEGRGRCVEDEGEPQGYYCVCFPGYSGVHCDVEECSSLNATYGSPSWITPLANTTWRNDASCDVTIYYLTADGGEQRMFAVPVAASKTAVVQVDYVWLARDHTTRKLLPLQGQCSYVLPRDAQHATDTELVVTNTL